MKKVLFMAGGAVGGYGVPVRNGLVAEYRFNERGGLTLYDRSGNVHNGTLGSDPFGADANDPAWTTGGALFDGGDYIDCGNFVTTSPDFTQLSVLCLITGTAFTDGDIILAKYVGTGNQRSWQVAAGAVDRFKVFISKAGTAADKNYMSPVCIAAGTPSLIGFTINANTLKLYKNNGGELSGVTKTTDNDTATIFQSTAPLKHGTTFRGTISYAVIYNRALSVDEIATIYTYLKANMKKRGITLP
jgi:hypothetical protein